MKTSAGKKFLLCFRPVVSENRAIKSDSKNSFKDMCFEYKPKDQIDDREINKSQSFKSMGDSESGGGRSRKKKSARKILSEMAKTVLFDTSLKKKVRNGKVVQDPSRSESSLSAKIEKISKLMDEKSNLKKSEEQQGHWKLNSLSSSDYSLTSSSSSSSTLTYSSSLSSSSTSSSSSSSSSWQIPDQSKSTSWITFSGSDKSFRLNSFDKKQSKETKKSSYFCIIGLCLLLFSLSVLIFWGKVCAILCTSTWFYFVSTTRRKIQDHDDDGSEVVEKSSPEEVESKEYKKKVIMEGLLERNSNHRLSFNNLQHQQQ